MSDIYQLLNIDTSALRDFPLLALQATDRETERVMAQSARRLKAIEDAMLIEGNVQFAQATVEEVIEKVVRCAEMDDDSGIRWSSLELRIISYYPMLLQAEDRAYDYAFSLLDKHWKNLYFNGLVFYVLNGWNMMHLKFREPACDLIKRKLSAYDGTNRRYLTLKNHADYFDESGPLRLAMLLTCSETALSESPRLIAQVPSAISFSFFSDVIVKYVEKMKIRDFETLEEIFKLHQLDRTKKLVLANLVIEAESNGNEQEQLLVSKFGEHILGDISLSVTWSPFAGANVEQIAQLRKAKELVNKWYTRRVIEVFFKVCVQDEARKNFWLSKVNLISDFRVAGSRLVQATLEGNEMINSLLARYFIKTNAKRSQTAALILSIKSRVFIEFSDVGALYVYKIDNNHVSFLFEGNKTISDTRELKDTDMPMLATDDYWGYTDMEEEGKMNHMGNWERRLKNGSANIFMTTKLLERLSRRSTTRMCSRRYRCQNTLQPLPSSKCLRPQ